MRGRRVFPFLAATCLLQGSVSFAGDPRRIPMDRHEPTLEERVEPQAFRPEDFVSVRRSLPMTAGPAGEIGSAVLPANQSETSVAVSGSSVVVGYNDFRGFGLGIMYSTDGGATFADAGLLPLPAGYGSSGDPGVAVWTPPVGPPVFYCTSILYHPNGDISFALHRSVDGGATWAGPFIVTSTVVPSTDFPDREAICVDPETGRLLLTWANFSTTVTIRVTYSDDAATGSPPAWSAPALVGTRAQDGEATTIVANPVNDEVYLAWETYPPSGKRDIAFVKSTNNGTGWGAPTDIGPEFYPYQCPWGFDRWLWSFSGSSLAYNPADGGLEIVYAASVNGTPSADFGDVYFRRSVNGGTSWSAPQPLNVSPGTGRPQALPCVTVADNGRIDVFWYDLSAGAGMDDYTDLYYCFSSNLGATWSSPVPVDPEPFHDESGNNFGAPHQGDYMDADSYLGAGGESHAAFAVMDAPSATSTGANGSSFRAAGIQVAPLRVRPNTVTFVDYGCHDRALEAGETADVRPPLENIGRSALTGITGTLTALTPLVTVLGSSSQAYPGISPGYVLDPVAPFSIALDPSYPCGVPARFRLDITAVGVAPTYCEFSLPTGVVSSETTLMSENFDGVVAPALPAGWAAVTLTGTPAPWRTTTTTPASGPNAAFCPDPLSVNFERLQGPVLAIPAGTSYVEVTFDTKHDLRQADSRFGFDGLTFDYQLDGAGGSHHSVGDATYFEPRYTHNIIRDSGGGSGDRSAWSGTVPAYRTATIRIPGLAGHTMTPRFQLTTSGIPASGTGAWVDNVVVEAVTLGCLPCTPTGVSGPLVAAGLSLAVDGPNPFQGSSAVRYTLPRGGRVRVELFDLRGRRVRVLAEGWREAGVYHVPLVVARPGVYFVRLEEGGERRTLRVVCLE